MYENENGSFNNFTEVSGGNDDGWTYFDLMVVNATNGMQVQVQTTEANCLKDIYDTTKEDLGLPSGVSKVLYINKNSRESTGDSSKTLAEFGIRDSSGALQINADCVVA